MNPLLHVGHLPDHLDARVIDVPGRVHPRELGSWLLLCFATRADGARAWKVAFVVPTVADNTHLCYVDHQLEHAT